MVDLLVFAPACFALNLAFGPNNLLAMNHGGQGGIRFATAASTARLLVFAPMIAASALGLGVLLAASATAFSVMKLIGAAYLIWMGIKLLRSRPDADDIDSVRKGPTLRIAFRREGLSAISNPKAILIFAAFFPQFVDVQAYWESYAILGTVFLLLEMLAILIYATVGHFAAAFAATRLHWFQRASGIGMLVFGILLLLSPQPVSASR
ncbi:LysE family translocator [Rhodospirillaceae bacterium KN72]|uniref:LysE family translocator n=1 Tax=Pacificispira spongiicola TaxID=2729598 RepID=A0A7Y0HDM2_9PROT|nr:LysE family translocator [Pacificispira spongiicola]NMM43986.1 LysE family translocator [Pacificispira spongiicola]